MSSFSAADFFRARTVSELDGLIKRLSESDADFPTASVTDVASGIARLSGYLIDILKSSASTSQLEYISGAVRYLSGTLSFFDNAHSAQTPRSLALMLEDINSRIFPQATVVLWPQAEFNYTIRNLLPAIQHFSEAFLTDEQKQGLFKRPADAIQFISFPRILRDNILLHSILGHELGHPVANEILDEEAKALQYGDRLQAISKVLEAKYSANGELPLIVLKNTQDAVKYVCRLRRRALEELLSDVTSVYLFGPSAMFAMYELFGASQLDAIPTPPDFYPPTRMRLRMMWEVCDGIGMLSVLRTLARNLSAEVAQGITGALDEVSSLAGVKSDQEILSKSHELNAIAYQWASDALPLLADLVKSKLGTSIYAVDAVGNDVPDLMIRIDLGIPPNERGVFPDVAPVDWRSAILAGWLVKLGAFPAGGLAGNHEETATRISRMERLTLKAVEYVILQSQYSDAKVGGFA